LLSTPSREDAVTLGYEVQTQLRQGLSPCQFDALTSALAFRSEAVKKSVFHHSP
jgi:hypothetical protein